MMRIFTLIIGCIFTLLCGCTATNTALTKHSLNIESKMSDSIFLDPVPEKEKTIYVTVRNTSDFPKFDLKTNLDNALAAKGYKVVSDIDKAHYILQANVRQVGKTTPKDAKSTLKAGYGGALSGAIIGVTAGAVVGDTKDAAVGGLIGGATGYLANTLVKDVAYTVITDVQISERAKKGEIVQQQQQANLQQGSSTTVKEMTNTTSDWHRYRTRIVSIADKMNLSFDTAQPALESNQASALSGIF